MSKSENNRLIAQHRETHERQKARIAELEAHIEWHQGQGNLYEMALDKQDKRIAEFEAQVERDVQRGWDLDKEIERLRAVERCVRQVMGSLDERQRSDAWKRLKSALAVVTKAEIAKAALEGVDDE